jgi:hypothetical protein
MFGFCINCPEKRTGAQIENVSTEETEEMRKIMEKELEEEIAYDKERV